jgi:hypothetical protein
MLFLKYNIYDMLPRELITVCLQVGYMTYMLPLLKIVAVCYDIWACTSVPLCSIVV